MNNFIQSDPFVAPPEDDLTTLFQRTAMSPMHDARQILEKHRPSLRRETPRMKKVLRWGLSLATSLILLAFLGAWCSATPKPLWAQAVVDLSQSTSVRCRVHLEYSYPTVADKPAIPQASEGTFYFAKNGCFRHRMKAGEEDYDNISPANAAGMHIDHRSKTFSVMPAGNGKLPSWISIFERVAKSRSEAKEDLGESVLEGRNAHGYVVDIAKVMPDVLTDGGLHVWVDLETKRLVRMECRLKGTPECLMTFDQFFWNEPSNDWFTVKAPDGYVNATLTPPKLEEMTNAIVLSLKTYAKYADGNYPRVKFLYGDVTSAKLAEMNGADKIIKSIFGKPMTDEAIKLADGPVYQEYNKALAGFAYINRLERENPDVEYHGLTVTARDKEKVLFRWRLESGEYQVIFGDLSHRRVLKEELQVLESK